MSHSKSEIVSIPQTKSVSSADDRVASVPVRVMPRTKKKLEVLLKKVNKDRASKKVKASDVIDYAVELLTNEHLNEISEHTLSNKDRFERLFRQNQKARNNLSRDEFLGVLIGGMNQS